MIAFVIVLLTGGCAVGPVLSQNQENQKVVAERDLLNDAAREVERAPWPKPQSVSFVARLSGAADENRISRSDAVDAYVNRLQPAGLRFHQLAQDARANLSAASRLSRIAYNTVDASRVTMNDVATVEDAIQALRENSKIYSSAARELEKLGEPVDETQVDEIRTAYSAAIRSLGNAADALAERIEKDRTETIAARRERQGG
ncbi:hypothetical protein PUV54_02435 [Hyphococcus flavus]|uniref:Uncharacterized protein n=1 Tax=Hyphococcus flavus TaxID=1866326 RepID=A0AAE9ZFK4_9PROT|nr:hypothetical protein [Hyphococcus flavus]WDI32047.1 hypothetical protein PUV54_02435 [Hyphococcus flavus]